MSDRMQFLTDVRKTLKQELFFWLRQQINPAEKREITSSLKLRLKSTERKMSEEMAGRP